MTGADVERIIANELSSAINLDTWVAVFVNKHLVKPYKEAYLNSFDETQTFEFWTVLIEDNAGYRIAFDEEEEDFVLGMINNEGRLEYIGHQGTFIEALYGL